LWGFGIKVCNLDNVRNPYRGIVFEMLADAGRKHGDEEKPIFQSNIFYDISAYIGFRNYFTIKLRNSSKMLYSKSIYANELLWVGGLNTMRGFDELSLPATYYTLGNIEFRYLFERSSAVYVLADAMYFGKKFTDSDNSNYAVGLGVGIDLGTSAGIFSLIYAIGKQNDNSFNFSNSKIHFGYKSYF
jgi:hemolysin activation/secretion protein